MTMEKTNIESAIMDMLTPKLEDIQNRFSKGEKLNLQDFNLLLLKTQYNHINHLDMKLDEVSKSVVSLENKLNGLENKFNGLENKFNLFKTEITSKFELLETQVNARLDTFEAKLTAFEKKIESKVIEMESKMKETIITNMKWTIGSIVTLVAVLKIFEMIFS